MMIDRILGRSLKFKFSPFSRQTLSLSSFPRWSSSFHTRKWRSMPFLYGSIKSNPFFFLSFLWWGVENLGGGIDAEYNE